MHQIVRGISYEDSFLGVTLGGMVFPNGIVMVDAPIRTEDARMWRTALLNQRGGSNRILINLDAHPDRTLGARTMDCTVVAQQKTAQVFRNRPTIFKGQSIETGSVWELYADAIGMRWATPDITFTHRMSIHWGGPEIILDHHPGPTAGSCWVIIPEQKIIFVGDTLSLNQPPFLASADLEAWNESLGLLLKEFADFIIVAGRGGLAGAEEVKHFQQKLKKIAHGLERLFKRNASPEATADLIPGLLSDLSYDASWESLYTQRLRFGLYQYYARQYRPSSILDQPRMDDDDQ